MPRPLFKDLDNYSLVSLLKELLNDNIFLKPDDYKDKYPSGTTEIFSEMCEHGTISSSTSQIKRLNRLDLINIIYAILMPEIKRIDSAPVDELPLLATEEWSVPQLKERVLDRLRNGE